MGGGGRSRLGGRRGGRGRGRGLLGGGLGLSFSLEVWMMGEGEGKRRMDLELRMVLDARGKELEIGKWLEGVRARGGAKGMLGTHLRSFN